MGYQKMLVELLIGSAKLSLIIGFESSLDLYFLKFQIKLRQRKEPLQWEIYLTDLCHLTVVLSCCALVTSGVSSLA